MITSGDTAERRLEFSVVNATTRHNFVEGLEKTQKIKFEREVETWGT
jgi:hypothetical protein